MGIRQRAWWLAAVVLPVAAVTQAATIHVDVANCPGPGDGSIGNPYCSIQTAIDNAVDTDEIVVASGTYFETVDLLGKTITLRSSDGPVATVIDGQAAGAVVTAVSGEGAAAMVEGFTVTGGTGDPSSGITFGGGMLIRFSDMTVRNCIFDANFAEVGGGMYIREGSPDVIGCHFSNNGGLIGAGLTAELSTMTVIGCSFADNAATLDAGAMELGRGDNIVIGCTFLRNTAEFFGGGLLSGNADTVVVNCLFADNSSGFTGGGIWAGANTGVLHLINSTVTQNDAPTGGGMYNSGPAPRFVSNCVFWANTDDGGMDESAQIDADEIEIDVSYSCVQGGWSGDGTANIALNPLFMESDFRLSSSSPCIDAADNTAVPGYVATDLDGNPRFLDVPETPDCQQAPGTCGDPPVVDMGAYESLGDGCLAVTSRQVDCHADGTTFTVTVDGLNACTGGATQLTFTGSGGAPGEELCFTALVNDGGFCCSTEICVAIPDCTPVPQQSDLDGNGGVGIEDLLALLAAWGPCSDCATCPPDFNGDCVVGILDLLILLGNWG